MLTPYDGVYPLQWRDTLLTVRDSPWPDYGIIEVGCALRNIGPGPALNLGIMFRFHDMGEYTTDPWELTPLRAGECRGGESDPLRIPIPFRRRFNNTDFAQVPGKSWELILVYEDIFGNSFYSTHPKHLLQLNRLDREADTPEVVALSQPWVVLGKGKPPVRSAPLNAGFASKPTS